jgi:uncharacterized membrane protein (DUF106 family)
MTREKLINLILDGLMFIVPFLELTELMAVIPLEWLPWYMLATVVLRRLIRVLEERKKINVYPELDS